MPAVTRARGLRGMIGASLFAASLFVTCLLAAGTANAGDVKIGVLAGVTGPAATATPPLLDAVNLVADEVNANGGILGGQKLQAVVGDTKDTSHGAIKAATRLVDTDKVAALVDTNTSLATIATAHAVAIPKGVVLISSTATATVLTTLEDHDFVFRVVPSDAYQGWMLAHLAYREGFTRVALSYVDTDYGSGMEDTFRDNFENLGGTITSSHGHEANKESYLPELAALRQYDPEALVLITYAANGGITMIKEALANGSFKQFIGTYSLMNPLLIKEMGPENSKHIFFTAPTLDRSTSAAMKFEKLYSAAYKTTDGKLNIAQTYDAAMLLALAIEQAGSTDRTKVRDALRQICCGPGEEIEPGEWAKAKADIAAGKKINYEGASGHCDFDENGDVTGVYGHYIIENGAFKEVELLKPE